jgi:hypothetical protein
MTPLEEAAKAIAKEEWGIGETVGPWSDNRWTKLADTTFGRRCFDKARAKLREQENEDR